MIILKVWFSEYPWDVRVEKIARALADGGHEVHLLCRNNSGDSRNDNSGKVSIHRLPCLVRGKSHFLNKLINVPAFFNPTWFLCIFWHAWYHRVDVILVRDLPLTLPSILAGKLLRRNVVFDMAECHTEIFKNYFKWGLKSILKENPLIAIPVERLTLLGMDHTFVMCEESKERLVNLGASAQNISVVSNTTVIQPDDDDGPANSDDSRLRMIYVGLVGEFRGLGTVLEAIRTLKDEHGLEVTLDVLGQGDFLSELKKQAAELVIEDNIVFHGWVDHEEIEKHIRNSDIGVLPLYYLSHYNVTVSNKLFDYMACSKPVICSHTDAMARIVGETDCGLVFEARSVTDFVSCVLRLRDPDVRHQLGKNGQKAVRQKYNWKIESARMLDAVERVVGT